ncbi:hypothetical protein [Streptomyces sp. DH24]|uniref:hypothetical protein n=1 Tax=Streptomyces sp. DH24 TaxID=3040123 RepID=UPI002441EFC1|nr:hypothetical protein [Streptomyces sp. DH24]MDG9719970.1 hypothetical protein [Streptomyces sp. DH24]
MKLRHVRAVAIAVGVVVALTGARHSGGGGCSGSDSSSSSSSTSGGSSGGHYDDDDDVDVDVPDVDTGVSSGGASSDATSGSGSAAEAASDLEIDNCAYEEARGLVARVTATNSDPTTPYSYDFTVVFKDPSGATIKSTTDSIAYVPAAESRTQDVATPYVPSGTDATDGTCEITDATKTAV